MIATVRNNANNEQYKNDNKHFSHNKLSFFTYQIYLIHFSNNAPINRPNKSNKGPAQMKSAPIRQPPIIANNILRIFSVLFNS